MELSAELFEQTIRAVKGDVATGSQDRRVNPRVGCRCRLTLILIENGKPGASLDVWTRDISRSGMGLICTREIAAGSRFVVRFPRDNGESMLAMLCTVRSCRPLSGKSFVVGASFEGQNNFIQPPQN